MFIKKEEYKHLQRKIDHLQNMVSKYRNEEYHPTFECKGCCNYIQIDYCEFCKLNKVCDARNETQ